MFLVLFSYVMLCEFYYYETDQDGNVTKLAKDANDQYITIVVSLWVIAIIIEELRQVGIFVSASTGFK